MGWSSSVGEVFAMATLASSCRGGRNASRERRTLLKIPSHVY